MMVIHYGRDVVFRGALFFGLVFSALSLAFGAANIWFHHDPFRLDAHHGGDHGNDVTPVNVSTVLAFLAWFGGVGYLARHGFGWYSAVSVVVGIAGGLIGAVVIFWSLARVVRPMEGEMRADDYRLPGTIAQVTSSIRAGGTGEILYQQGGVRQVAAARATDGSAIPRGVDVVVLRIERGIAYVETWDSLMEERKRPLAEVGDGAALPSRSERRGSS